MAPGKMQMLKPVYEYLQIIGLSAHQSTQKSPFNARNVTSLSLFGMYTICNVGFLMLGKNDMKEYVDSIYLTVTIISAISILSKLIWTMRELFEFFRNVENTVNQSKKWKLIFLSLNLNDTFNGNNFCHFFPFLVIFFHSIYRTFEPNIKTNLHENQWRNSEISKNHKVHLSNNFPTQLRCAPRLSQLNRVLYNWFRCGCIWTASPRMVSEKCVPIFIAFYQIIQKIQNFLGSPSIQTIWSDIWLQAVSNMYSYWIFIYFSCHSWQSPLEHVQHLCPSPKT